MPAASLPLPCSCRIPRRSACACCIQYQQPCLQPPQLPGTFCSARLLLSDPALVAPLSHMHWMHCTIPGMSVLHCFLFEWSSGNQLPQSTARSSHMIRLANKGNSEALYLSIHCCIGGTSLWRVQSLQ